EVEGSRKVLSAAAMTYVAALAGSVLQLLRLLILAGGRNRD
ncbi:MAG: zinc metallopeptidase, partial [Blautia sp.]